MERWLRDIENFLVASDRFEEKIDGKNFDLIRKALERMKPIKPERRLDGWNCPRCEMFQTHEWEVDQPPFCWNCGQALDWSE